MTFYSVALFLLLNVFSSCSISPQKEDPSVTKLDLYLLIGQSNMAGRADIELQDKDSLNGVFLFTGLENNEWEPAANPMNKYSTIRKRLDIQKLGPGYSFAKEMAEKNPGKQIGIVVNAKGGTTISQWMPGTQFYNEAVKRAKQAAKSGSLKGVVWHQGEGDINRADSYMNDLEELILSLRKDLDNENLPFVAGQLSPDNIKRKQFNDMILELSQKIKNTGVVKTDNTATIDKTHFDSKSQRLLGKRYAEEMQKLRD